MSTTEASAGFDPNGAAVQKLRKQITSPWQLRAFMAAKLPLALLAGLRVSHLDADSCDVSVPYGWRSTNPFRSTYFAALSMAAEMCTGALAMSVVQAAPRPVSMLITGMTAQFVKKATRTTTFRCEDGRQMIEAVVKTLDDGEPIEVTCDAIGRDPEGAEIACFTFTWSFKRKR